MDGFVLLGGSGMLAVSLNLARRLTPRLRPSGLLTYIYQCASPIRGSERERGIAAPSKIERLLLDIWSIDVSISGPYWHGLR